MFEYVKDMKMEHAEPYTPRKKTDSIVLHHFASDATPEQVHQYHVSRGHKGIDYNIVVLLDGQAFWGRGLVFEGGHVRNSGVSKGMNARSIGIACQGNFEERTMPEPQKDMLLRIIWDCLRTYPCINSIIGHREVAATACPGRNFPLSEAKTQMQAHKDSIGAAKLAGAVPGKCPDDMPEETVRKAPAFTLLRLLKYSVPHMRGQDVRAVQRELERQGFSVGTCGADGVFGKWTQKGVKLFQQNRKLKVDGVVGENTTRALGGEWKGVT